MQNKDCCGIIMRSEKDNILEFNQYMKPDKMLYITQADIESLTKKIDGCANNPENSSATKISEHISSGYLIPIIWVFHYIENKHDLYHGKDRMRNFCKPLIEHEKNINHFENKKKCYSQRKKN